MRCGCQGISGLLRKALLWTAAWMDSDTTEGHLELPGCGREAVGVLSSLVEELPREPAPQCSMFRRADPTHHRVTDAKLHHGLNS